MNKALESSIRNKIGFTEDDLIANRDGKLSDNQYQKLRAEQRIWLLHARFMFGIAIVILVAIVLINVGTSTARLFYAAIVLIVLSCDLVFVWINWSRYRTDLKNGIVLEIQGRLEPITSLGKYSRYYDLRVKNDKLSIDKSLYELLVEIKKEHPHCIVYYAPKSKLILAFEAY